MPEYGPFETDDEARALPAVQAIFEAFDHGFGTGDLSGAPLITAACEAAGIGLGAYDARTIEWMGNWEPHTCAVFAGLIIRAHEAGKAAAAEGTVTEWGACRRGEAEPFVSGPDEAAVRRFAVEMPHTVTGLVRRQITPWKEAPDGQAPE